VPLLREATWIACLADFSELPPDLRTLVLKQVGDILSQRQRQRLVEMCMERVWQELDLDEPAPLVHVIGWYNRKENNVARTRGLSGQECDHHDQQDHFP